MKSISGVLFCVLAATACATDDPQMSSTEPGDEAAALSEPPKVVTLTPELSLAPLPEGKVVGNRFEGTTNACHVTLEFCRDPRATPHRPTYCSTGCSFPNDFNQAISLCHSICGNIDCNTMYIQNPPC